MIESQPQGEKKSRKVVRGISKERGHQATKGMNVFEVKNLCHAVHMSSGRKCCIYTVSLGRLSPPIVSGAIQTNNDEIKKRPPCRYTENRNNNRSKSSQGKSREARKAH
jgi:hypothetical protein